MYLQASALPRSVLQHPGPPALDPKPLIQDHTCVKSSKCCRTLASPAAAALTLTLCWHAARQALEAVELRDRVAALEEAAGGARGRLAAASHDAHRLEQAALALEGRLAAAQQCVPRMSVRQTYPCKKVTREKAGARGGEAQQSSPGRPPSHVPHLCGAVCACARGELGTRVENGPYCTTPAHASFGRMCLHYLVACA